MITEEMKQVTIQQHRELHVKIEIIRPDRNLFFGEISGVCLNVPNITQDLNSGIRRTCTVECLVVDSTFEIKPDSKIWIDKKFILSIGIKHDDGHIVWFRQGEFLMNQPEIKYNGIECQLTITGVDLMANLTGLRNGNIEGITTIIPADSYIPNVIASLLQEQHITSYQINIPNYNHLWIPNEMRYEAGATTYDILEDIRDLYAVYQIYFDEYGVFHYEPLYPENESDVVVKLNNDVIDKVLMGYTVDYDFESVKNVVQVIGASYDVDYFATRCELDMENYCYNLTVPSLQTLHNGDLYGFVPDEISDGVMQVKVNDFGKKDIIDSTGDPKFIPKPNEYYVLKYQDGDFVYIGTQQITATAKDLNEDSPFYVGGAIGEIRIVLSDGEYENITTEELAVERARYELWLRTRVKDSIKLTTIPIYYINVGDIIEFTHPTNNQTYKYMVQNISTDINSQVITCTRYYPLYPF